jgi:hypothetical protein
MDPIAIQLAMVFLLGLGFAALKIALRRRWLRDHPDADIGLSPVGSILAGVWLVTSVAIIAARNMHPESELGQWLSSPEMMALFVLAAVLSLVIIGVVLHAVGITVVTPRKARDV